MKKTFFSVLSVFAIVSSLLAVGGVPSASKVSAIPPAPNPFDASRAIRYTAEGTVIGSVVRSLVNVDDKVTTYPSGFPTNFFGTKYDNICITANGGVFLTNSPVKVTTSADPIAQGDCNDIYDNSVSYMAISSDAPFISVLASDHKPANRVYMTPTQQIFDTTVTTVTGGGTTIESGVPHGLGVGNVVDMYASPTGNSSPCPRNVSAVASATEFTIDSTCGSTPVRFGRPRQYGDITAVTVSAGLVTVTMSAHHLATGNLITFAGLNIPQLDDQHFEVTRLSATEVSFPAPAGIDPSLSGLAPLGTSADHKYKWFESDGYGAVGQMYYGVTTVDSRPAMVVTWYRVPMYEDNNPRVRYSTIQLVLVQKPTGDSTVGFDFDVEFNYGSMTDDEDGYTVNSEEGLWACATWSTVAGSNCRWGIGWANYREVVGVESYSIANGLVTLTTTNPHGLKPGDLVRFETVSVSAEFEDDFGRAVAGTSGTTLITEAPWETYVNVALTAVPTPSSALLKVSDDFEMYANTWVGNLVDQSTVSATRMIVNNMNAPTVPGRYTFAMVGGVTQGFEAPAMGRPSSPRNVSATLSDTAMTVSWTEPLSNGGSTITGYTVRVFPGGASCTVSGSARSCIIAGLDPETAYTVEVVATNENGNSKPALALGAQAPAPLPQDLSNLPVVTPPPSTVVTPPPSTVAPSTTIPAPVPEQGGVLPALAPGASQVLVDGVPEVVEVVVVDSTVLALRGGGFQLTLSGECSYGCTIRTNAEGRQILEMEENGTAKVAGDGFMPGSTVYVWLFSEPKFLGELTVPADGTFAGGVSLAGVENGSHTLQVNGTSFDGTARTANLGVLVSPAGAPTVFPGSLPAAGSDAGWLVWVMLLTSVGGALVWANRRRTIAAQR